MKRHVIPLEAYIEAASVFHWATKRHYQLWFTGQARTRHRRTETVLRRLTVRGKLRAVFYQQQLVYALPRKAFGMKDEFAGLTKLAHGLSCTECLVRFFRSRTDGTIVPERMFTSLGAVPEWGIVYPEGTMLLLEFCTQDNFLFAGNITRKVAAYRKNLLRIEEKFAAKAVVVFVVDVKREVLERFVNLRIQDDGPYFFTDYETFLSVPFGLALQEPIYIWSSDRHSYPLTKIHV